MTDIDSYWSMTVKYSYWSMTDLEVSLVNDRYIFLLVNEGYKILIGQGE